MDMRIPPPRTNIIIESNPVKSRIPVRRLAVALSIDFDVPAFEGHACSTLASEKWTPVDHWYLSGNLAIKIPRGDGGIQMTRSAAKSAYQGKPHSGSSET